MTHQNLSSMMVQGRSFSGRERNCCFLNTGGDAETVEQFANVSAVTGLDYPDDGRAVAVVDWDHDGDLDLWFTNRNAPRLRLMRNDTPLENRFLSLQLQGNGESTNRDAIGARVEVVVKDEGARQLIKTLRAGEGFLAQSSKWLHFGLGDAKEVQEVLVRWPVAGGKAENVERFTRFELDGRYRLIEGRGTPQAVAPRSMAIALQPSVVDIPPATRIARIPAVTLLPGPRVMASSTATGRVVSTGAGKPVLLNLWASWCQPCLKELAVFRDRSAEIRAAGIEVIALSVDGLGDNRFHHAAAETIVKKLRFPFHAGMASEKLIASLQDCHNALVARNQPLPVPSSFLLDGDGRIAVIYKGPLSVDDLLADVNHSQGTRAERWARAAPMAGRVIEHTLVTRTADKLEGMVHFQRGNQNQNLGRAAEAAYHYRSLLGIKPDHVAAQNNLAWLLATHPNSEIRNGKEALRLATVAFKQGSGQDPFVLDTLAAAQAEAGRFTEAVATARKAIAAARSRDQMKLATNIEERIRLYRRSQPYRDPPHRAK